MLLSPAGEVLEDLILGEGLFLVLQRHDLVQSGVCGTQPVSTDVSHAGLGWASHSHLLSIL